MFLRYDFYFPAFRRRFWEEEPGRALEGREERCGNAGTARGGHDTTCKRSSVS